jgi:hypothetical protein
MSYRVLFFLLPALIFLPLLGLAEDASTDGVTLTNPIGTSDVRVIIGYVIKAALGISGSLALLMFVWGGFLWLTAAGNSDRIEKGKKVLIWSTLGLVVIFSAYTITNAVIGGITGVS